MGGSSTLQTVPSQADSYYVNFLNQTRTHEELLPDPTGDRTLPTSTPPKWAVLSVMTTKRPLSVQAIQVLLTQLSYPCAKDSIKRALQRCERFGLVEKGSFYKREYGVCRLLKLRAYQHNKWKLTDRGRSLVNAPRKTMKKETTADKVLGVMSCASKWMSVSDIADLTGCSKSAIRRNLRRGEHHDVRPGVYKSQKIPGDRQGRYQWAIHSIDTTGWANAAVPVVSSAPSKPKALAATTSAYQPATYGGLDLMCAPANKPSLIKAVGDLLVNEFVTSGNKFSAHDVTKRLRDLVLEQKRDLNAQLQQGTRQTYVPLVDPAETGDTMVNGIRVARVDHEDVKAIVHDIFNAGGMPNLGRLHVKKGSGSYWEYDTQANIDAYIAANPQQFTKAADPDPAADVTGSTTDPDPISGGTMGSTYDGSSTI